MRPSKAPLVAGAAFASAASAADIVLQSLYTNGYVQQDGGVLVARGNDRAAQRLEIIRLQGNRIALRTPEGTYVRAGVGQGTRLATGSPHIRGWETFEMVTTPDSRVHLKSVQNGRFVVADRRGTLSATDALRSAQSEFRVAAAPGRPGAGQRPPQQDDARPRFDWTGNWSFLRVAGPGGQLMAPPRNARVEFTVDRNMRVGVSVGCNRIGSQLRIQGRNRVEFTQTFSTRMLCQGALGRYERALIDAMSKVERFEYREGQVALLDRRGRAVMQIGRR